MASFLYGFWKTRQATTCRHLLVRKGYYLGLDSDDYVCVACGKRGPTKGWPRVAASEPTSQ